MLSANLLQAQSNPAGALAFQPGTNDAFIFDTGALRGVLRTGGKSVGLQSVTHIASGRRLDASMGLLSHYRVFTTGKRYGGAAWDWPSTAKLTERGAVEVFWPAEQERPFEMRAIYRWATRSALDLETTVTAKQDLSKFESFLASYLTSGFTNAMAAVGWESKSSDTPRYLPAVRSEGGWQMFPRDDEAVRVIQDGRWKLEPHPVDWAIRPRFAIPMGIRCDPAARLAVLVMAKSAECFAVSMPYETEGHYSFYLSQFGHDLKAGETAHARARLAILDSTDQSLFTRTWEGFANQVSKP